MKHRVGLLSLSDARERVYDGLLPVIEAYNDRLVEALEATGEVQVIRGRAPISSPGAARSEAKRLLDEGVKCTIFHQPVFGFPHFAVLVAQILPPPFLIISPKEPNYPSLVGLLTIGGAFAQLDIPHARIWGNIEEEGVLSRLFSFIRAASAVRRLRGQVYGMLGGRSMGLYTNAPAPNEWVKLFGVDVDQADELELVRRAETIDADRVQAGMDWLSSKLGGVNYDDRQLTRAKLDRQLRAYLATKEIIADYGWDFLGIKCHYQLSEYYAVQCLSASFLNDPYDWEGPKEPVITSCETDSDGALTMQLLHLLTDLPVTLQDIRYYDPAENLWVMMNCGASPTWYATRSDSPEDNLARTRFVPAVPKYAGGGAHVWFQFKEGPVTLARLQRAGSVYQLVILNGTIEDRPVEAVVGSSKSWPLAFARLDPPADDLVQTLNANHLHLVPGDFTESLELVGKFLGIEVIRL